MAKENFQIIGDFHISSTVDFQQSATLCLFFLFANFYPNVTIVLFIIWENYKTFFSKKTFLFRRNNFQFLSAFLSWEKRTKETRRNEKQDSFCCSLVFSSFSIRSLNRKIIKCSNRIPPTSCSKLARNSHQIKAEWKVHWGFEDFRT